jgi:hypothetical protein
MQTPGKIGGKMRIVVNYLKSLKSACDLTDLTAPKGSGQTNYLCHVVCWNASPNDS